MTYPGRFPKGRLLAVQETDFATRPATHKGRPRPPIVIIYGTDSPGRREALYLAHFRCTRTVAPWDGQAPLQPGDIAYTFAAPPFRILGARAIPAAIAKAAATNKGDTSCE